MRPDEISSNEYFDAPPQPPPGHTDSVGSGSIQMALILVAILFVGAALGFVIGHALK